MKNVHRNVGHLGISNVVSHTREKYWILGSNRLARRIVGGCITCRKNQSSTLEQQMAPIHESRLQVDQPCFTSTGCDYFGPFIVTNGRKTEKRYGVIFTCATTRAMHIEVSHDMTTNSFIQAVRRFISRRGQIRTLTSDNGSNLRGAERELRALIQAWNQEHIERWLQQLNIEWNFNPVGASHYGSVFEREIRTIRKIFAASLIENVRLLNDESLVTLFCEIEAILNSRPLTELSSSPDDLEALTPNYLLLGRLGAGLPPCPCDEKDSHHKRQWRRVQHCADVFWNRWKREYVTTLQVRQKWTCKQPNLKAGDLVLVVDSNLPRNQWSLGRVTRPVLGNDGLCRAAFIRVNKFRDSDVTRIGSIEIERPIVKLVLLSSS